MIIEFIGAAEELTRSTIAAFINTDTYLSKNSIPSYVTSYFGEDYLGSVTKNVNDTSYILNTQYKFNTIVFYRDNLHPIGYCILNTTMDMIGYGITKLTIDLSYLEINKVVAPFINIETDTNYSGHNSSNLHSALASKYVNGSSAHRKVQKRSIVTSSIQESILNGGLTKVGGNLVHSNKEHINQLNGGMITPIATIENYLDYYLTDEFNNWRIQLEDIRSNGSDWYVLKNNDPTPSLTYYKKGRGLITYDRSQDADDPEPSDRLIFLILSDIVIKFSAPSGTTDIQKVVIYDINKEFDTGSEYLFSTPDAILFSGEWTDSLKGSIPAINLLTRTFGICFNSRTLSKYYPLELDRLIDNLGVRTTLRTAEYIHGYTDSVIVFNKQGKTYFVTDAKIGTRQYFSLENVAGVEAVSNRAFIVMDSDTNFKLLKFIPDPDNFRYIAKIYSLGEYGNWRKLESITTKPRTINIHDSNIPGNAYFDRTLNPLFTLWDGFLPMCYSIDDPALQEESKSSKHQIIL